MEITGPALVLLFAHLVGLVGYNLLLRRTSSSGVLQPWVLATLLQTGITIPVLVALPFLTVEIDRITPTSGVAFIVAGGLTMTLLFAVTKALHNLEVSTFAVIYNVRILIAALLAALLLAEIPSVVQIIGGLLILASIFTVRQKGKQRVTKQGFMWGIVAAASVSALSVVEKYAINEVGVQTAAPIVAVSVCIVMWAVVFIKKYPLPRKHILNRQTIGLMALRALSAWALILAFAAGVLVSVATFVSAMSVVIIVALGALLLGERDYLKRKIIAVSIAVVGLAAVLLGGGTWQLVPSQPTYQEAEVVTHSTNTPDEQKPSFSYKWRGQAHDPKKIVIPGIGVDSYLQNVGVDQNREVAVPSNIHMAGWFVDSVLPGERGLSIIDGHLNGVHSDGIFIDLEKVSTGAMYTIEFGDGSVKKFKVKSKQIVDMSNAASVLFSQDPSITHQVTLITCGGNYNQDERMYDKRVIIVSELVQ